METTTLYSMARYSSFLIFSKHIKELTQKAARILKAMTGLCNSRGGISPKAARSLYTGMVRPIFSYGSELWHRPHLGKLHPSRCNDMLRLEYPALRSITGACAYHGSAASKLRAIAGIEVLNP